MMTRGTLPWRLKGLGLLAVAAVAALLLPVMPSWAQQNHHDDQARVILQLDQKPQPKDLDKARAELKRAADDLENMERHMQKLRAEFELRAAALRKAQEQLKQAEKAAGEQKRSTAGERKETKKDAIKGVVAGGMGQGAEQRLAELERKVDMMLQEIRDLRRSMGKGPTPGAPMVTPFPKDTKPDVDIIFKKSPGQPGKDGKMDFDIFIQKGPGQGGGKGGAGGGGKGGAGGGGGGKGGGSGQGGGGGAGFIIIDPANPAPGQKMTVTPDGKMIIVIDINKKD